MARSFLSFAFALAAATVMAFGAGATPVSAQQTASPPANSVTPNTPATPITPSRAPRQRGYSELDEAKQVLLTKGSFQDAFKLLEQASRKYRELPSPHV